MNTLKENDLILFKRSNGKEQIGTVNKQIKKNFIHVKWIERSNQKNCYRTKFVRLNDIVHVFSKPFLNKSIVLNIICLLLLLGFISAIHDEYIKVFKSK